ncbi:MAG: fatty acid desaturase [Bryobacterales bacterium]|nr:fatty acid desaturase [Bryobacterales bacterium]
MDVWLMLLITVVIMQVSVLWTTIYLHRGLTHKGLEIGEPLATLMHLHICLFTTIVPREWVAVHRKHHQYSDKEGDPHSPYLEGLWHVFFGNVFYYRRAANDVANVRKYTPDYRPTLIDKIPGQARFGLIVGMAIFVLMFGWAWGIGLYIAQGITYIFLNASINSICHMIGYRNWDNKATNLKSLALITGGEGLHNNHHEYPTAAHFAMKGAEFDPAWPIIKVFEGIGQIRVKRAPIAKAA